MKQFPVQSPPVASINQWWWTPCNYLYIANTVVPEKLYLNLTHIKKDSTQASMVVKRIFKIVQNINTFSIILVLYF